MGVICIRVMNKELSQAEIVDYLLQDEWVVEDDDESIENFKAALAKIDNPQSLHVFARSFNHDCGSEELLHILDHAYLDKATVLALYWMSAPGYYQQYEYKSDMPEYEQDNFDIIMKFHDRLNSASKIDASINFDPKNDEGTDWTNEYRKEMKALSNKGKCSFYIIPKEFFNAV